MNLQENLGVNVFQDFIFLSVVQHLDFILLFDVYVCIQTPHAMSVLSVLRGEKRAWDSLPGIRDSC